jgi:hypothetical protein
MIPAEVPRSKRTLYQRKIVESVPKLASGGSRESVKRFTPGSRQVSTGSADPDEMSQQRGVLPPSGRRVDYRKLRKRIRGYLGLLPLFGIHGTLPRLDVARFGCV